MSHAHILEDMTASPWATVQEIEKANDYAGQSFFGADERRFFKSRIGERTWYGRIFTTSEKGPDEIRRYTVRQQRADGSLDSLGGFQAYDTAAAVRNAAEFESGKCQLRDRLAEL